MDIHEAAKALDGSEYGSEGSRELFAQMKASGLIAMYGYSDDGVLIDGAERDQLENDTIYFTSNGRLKNRCEEDNCPYHAEEKKSAATISPIWCEDVGDTSGFAWRFKTDIPHATFIVKEDDELFCEGIVFALKDVKKAD